MDMGMQHLMLDGTKLGLYPERVAAWKRGERIAPITIDMALTRACNFNCVYCYGKLQENARETITPEIITQTMEDFAEIGVKGVSLVSDGESTCSPHLVHAVKEAHRNHLAIALGTNGALLTPSSLTELLSRLSYLRFNISAGTEQGYNEIMRPGQATAYSRVLQNIRFAVAWKKQHKLPCTIGMQMVLMPQFAREIKPLSRLAIQLGVDYLVIKHCSDDEDGSLGVDYSKYDLLEELLKEAEAMSTKQCKIIVKWSKIRDGNLRSYEQCYGPPFLLQISGSGLVAPCGMFFGEKYKQYHIGNICKDSFKKIWESEWYWKVMQDLGSHVFNAKTMCGCLCLQHSVNKALDEYQRGINLPRVDEDVQHKEFI